MKKILLAILCVAVIIISQVNVLAIRNPYEPGYNEELVNDDLINTSRNIWATIVLLIQMLCVGCMVFAGLRYMFASADQKADIKQGLIYLAGGAFIVFGAISIIQLVTNTANSIIVTK